MRKIQTRGGFILAFKAALELHCKFEKAGKYWFALCPEVDIASQGLTKEEAMENLNFTIKIHMEDRDSKVHETLKKHTRQQLNLDSVHFFAEDPQLTNVSPIACKN